MGYLSEKLKELLGMILQVCMCKCSGSLCKYIHTIQVHIDIRLNGPPVRFRRIFMSTTKTSTQELHSLDILARNFFNSGFPDSSFCYLFYTLSTPFLLFLHTLEISKERLGIMFSG